MAIASTMAAVGQATHCITNLSAEGYLVSHLDLGELDALEEGEDVIALLLKGRDG